MILSSLHHILLMVMTVDRRTMSHHIKFYACGVHVKTQCRCADANKQKIVLEDKCPKGSFCEATLPPVGECGNCGEETRGHQSVRTWCASCECAWMGGYGVMAKEHEEARLKWEKRITFLETTLHEAEHSIMSLGVINRVEDTANKIVDSILNAIRSALTPKKDCPYSAHADDCNCKGMGGDR